MFNVTLSDCPMDENFFACLNSGMQTLTRVHMISSSIRISYGAAAIFSNGLALSRSLEHLEIDKECVFEPGAGLKLVEGIKRNKSLKAFTFSESNLSSVAMTSILGALSEGCLPKLATLNITLKNESDCTNVLTKLMSSDTCLVEDLIVNAHYSSSNMFQTDGARLGKPNLKLTSLDIKYARFDESYLTRMLPMMPALSRLTLHGCGISDISPIVDHLCRPNTAIKCIDLCSNQIGINQARKLVRSLADMRSLTDVDISGNPPWDTGSLGKKRTTKILFKVIDCWNLEKFYFRRFGMDWTRLFDKSLDLTMAINRAWRRELCYKKTSPPSKLLPLIIARALRKTKKDRSSIDAADVVLPLLRERVNDLMPAPHTPESIGDLIRN